MLDRLRALFTTEPVRVTTAVVAIVVFVAAKLGLLVDPQNVGEAAALLLPILLGGELARSQVAPAAAVIAEPASDALLADQVGGLDELAAPST